MTTNDLEMLDTFTTAYTDNTPTGDGLLRINWYNGDPKQRTPGAFFVSSRKLEALGLEAPTAPWKETERTFSSGKSEQGYEAPALKLMAIGTRQQDCIVSGDDGSLTWLDGRTDKNSRPQGWSVYVELLCVAQGFSHGPVVWSSKRVKTSMGILVGVLGTYRRELLDEVKKARKNPKIPAWAFWLPVRGAVDAKNTPIYEKTAGAVVTPPTLVLPAGEVGEVAKSLFVGGELLAYGEQVRGEWDAWLRTRPGDARVQAPAEVNTGAQATDDTLPF